MPSSRLLILCFGALIALASSPLEAAAEDLRPGSGKSPALLASSSAEASKAGRTGKTGTRGESGKSESGRSESGKAESDESLHGNELAPRDSEAASAKVRVPVLLPPRNIQFPVENQETLARIWQRRLSFLEARDQARVAEQEEELLRVKTVLAQENLFIPAHLLLLEARDLLYDSRAQQAKQRCELAARLAPAMPAAQICLARTELASDWKAVGPVFSALGKAASLSFNDLEVRGLIVADWLLVLTVAIFLAVSLLILLLILRVTPLALHDFNHLFPRGTPYWLSTLLALILFSLPKVLGLGWLSLLLLAAAASALLWGRREAVLVAMAVGLLVGAHFLQVQALRSVGLGWVGSAVYELERGEGAPKAVARLSGSLPEAESDEYAMGFALGRYHKRLGNYDEAKAAYEKARSIRESPELLNNLGTVAFLRGDTKGAIELFSSAAATGRLASAHFNLAKIHFREGRLEEGEKAQQRALAVDGKRIRAHGFQDDTRANLYLLDEPLSNSEISRLRNSEAGGLDWPSIAALMLVSGGLPLPLLLTLPLLVLLFVGGAQLLRRRLRPCSPCDICGRPVCPRCDPERGSASGTCSQCVSVFIRRSGVDGGERKRKEESVRKYRRRQRALSTVLSVLLPGAGHLYVGRTWLGALLVGTVSLLLSILAMRGAVFPSTTPAGLDFYWHVSLLCAGALALVWLAALVHLLRQEEL